MNILEKLWFGATAKEPTGYQAPEKTMNLWNKEQERLKIDPRLRDVNFINSLHDPNADHSAFWAEAGYGSGGNTQPIQQPMQQPMQQPIQPEVMGATSGYGGPVITGSGESFPVFSGFNPEDYAQIGDWAADYYTSRGHGATADRARLLAMKALEYHLDPYFATALGAQEGGWLRYASPYAENNYLGLGQRDDVSLDMSAATFEDWLDYYLPKIAHDPRTTHVHEGETPWGHRKHLAEIGGSNSPYQGNYNYYDEWLKNMTIHMQRQEAHRQQYYPALGGPMIGY